MGRKKLVLELENLDYAKHNYLTKKEISILHDKMKQLKKLRNLLYILIVLIISTNFVSNFKYFEYVFVLIGLLASVTLIYLVIDKIRIKKQIRVLIESQWYQINSTNAVKIKVYLNKFMDRMEIIPILVIGYWAYLSIAWAVIELI